MSDYEPSAAVKVGRGRGIGHGVGHGIGHGRGRGRGRGFDPRGDREAKGPRQPKHDVDRSRTCPFTVIALLGRGWHADIVKATEAVFGSAPLARDLALVTATVWPDTTLRELVDACLAQDTGSERVIERGAGASRITVDVGYMDYTGRLSSRPIGVVVHGHCHDAAQRQQGRVRLADVPLNPGDAVFLRAEVRDTIAGLETIASPEGDA
jgi:hypothetical protein